MAESGSATPDRAVSDSEPEPEPEPGPDLESVAETNGAETNSATDPNLGADSNLNLGVDAEQPEPVDEAARDTHSHQSDTSKDHENGSNSDSNYVDGNSRGNDGNGDNASILAQLRTVQAQQAELLRAHQEVLELVRKQEALQQQMVQFHQWQFRVFQTQQQQQQPQQQNPHEYQQQEQQQQPQYHHHVLYQRQPEQQAQPTQRQLLPTTTTPVRNRAAATRILSQPYPQVGSEIHEAHANQEAQEDGSMADPSGPRTRSKGSRAPKRPSLTREERIQVKTFRTAGWPYAKIAGHLGVSLRQVQFAVTQATSDVPYEREKPQIRISEEEVEKLIRYVTSSKGARRMAYARLPRAAGVDCTEWAVKAALTGAGFTRRAACRRSPLPEAAVQQRLDYARQHVDWTLADWQKVLWIEEHFISTFKETRTWVTMRVGEEDDLTCAIENVRKRVGWAFVLSWHGATKGFSLHWDRSWGLGTPENYKEHVAPVIDNWVDNNDLNQRAWSLMPDGLVRVNAAVSKELEPWDLRPIGLPPSSPELSPWPKVFTWIEKHVTEICPERSVVGELRDAYQDAWEKLPESVFTEGLESMQARCKAVIQSEGKYAYAFM